MRFPIVTLKTATPCSSNGRSRRMVLLGGFLLGFAACVMSLIEPQGLRSHTAYNDRMVATAGDKTMRSLQRLGCALGMLIVAACACLNGYTQPPKAAPLAALERQQLERDLQT